MRDVLADLDVQWADPDYDDGNDEDVLRHEIEEGTRGKRSLSDAIVQERYETQ